MMAHRSALAAMLMLAGFAAGAAAADAPQTSAAGKKLNILFIMSDDHGFQAISAYDQRLIQTPQIDRLAKDGMRFDRCYVTNSICGPSRAVILTGKYSHLNGFVQNGNRFNGAQQHVGKLLQAAGYQTAVIGKWHLETDPTGFDHWDILIGQGPYYNPPLKTAAGVTPHTGYTTDIITDKALAWLKEGRDPAKPFFLVYQHKAPHRQWQPAPRHLTLFDDVEIPEPDTLFDDYSGRGTPARVQTMTIAEHLSLDDLKLSPPRGFTPEQLETWNKAYGPKNEAFRAANLQGRDLVRWKYQRYAKDYLRCVTAVDENVGRVLDYLDANGLTDNTVVFYTSDQGWWLGEHGWYDKRWMYEESFRTPLIVRWPGVTKPGSVNADFAMNLDFAQTFLSIAGVEAPADMQGASLAPLLAGNTPKDWRKSMYYHYYEYPGPHMVHRHYGVRNERYKLMHFYQIDEWEMYDLEKDPQEMKSVYADPAYADVLREMKAELQRLREHYKDDGTVTTFRAEQARETRLQLALRYQWGPQQRAQLSAGEIEASPHGAALRLEGKGAAHSQASGGRLDPSGKPLAIGGWIRASAKTGVIAAQGGESHGYSLAVIDGRPTFSVRVADQLTTIAAPKEIAADAWTHLVGAIDREGRLLLYVQGEPVARSETDKHWLAQQPADGFSLGADSGSVVGPAPGSASFQGRLADVRLYWGPLDEATLTEWLGK